MISHRIEDVEKDLRTSCMSGKVSGRILLDRFSVIEESSRLSPAYVDDKYSGFYYHLGKYINPTNMLEINFDIGLLSGAFMISCKTVRKFVGFRERGQDYYSPRIGSRNIRLVMRGVRKFYLGTLYDDDFDVEVKGCEWDFVMISGSISVEKQLEYLDFIWPHMQDNGIIACENLGKATVCEEGFLSFCQSKNRKGHLFSTRYGTGLVQK